jgi:hypothetical protein
VRLRKSTERCCDYSGEALLITQPTYWNAYRWILPLDHYQLIQLKNCASQFRLLADREPEMNLMSNSGKQWRIQKLSSGEFYKQYGSVALDSIDFSARTLIEGLIAHGIVKPGDLNLLTKSLAKHAVAPIFRDRLLENLYNEERIQNIELCIASKLARLGYVNSSDVFHRESKLAPSTGRTGTSPPGFDSYGDGHSYASANQCTATRAVQQCHSSLCRQVGCPY